MKAGEKRRKIKLHTQTVRWARNTNDCASTAHSALRFYWIVCTYYKYIYSLHFHSHVYTDTCITCMFIFCRPSAMAEKSWRCSCIMKPLIMMKMIALNISKHFFFVRIRNSSEPLYRLGHKEKSANFPRYQKPEKNNKHTNCSNTNVWKY